MNSKKMLIGLLAVLIVLGGITVFVLNMDTSEKGDNTADDLTEIIYVNKLDADDINTISIKNETEEFSFTKAENGMWSMDGISPSECESNSVFYLASAIAGIDAVSITEENSQNLSAYGFDNPMGVIKFTTDKEEKTYLCGNKTPVGGLYYFMDADYNRVYEINYTTYTSVFKGKHNYRNTNIIRISTDELTHIGITNSAGSMVIEKTDDPIVTHGMVISSYKMKSPINANVDNSLFEENFAGKLKSITFKSIASDKGDFASYGLSSPKATLYMENAQDEKQTIYVGDKTDDGYYAFVKGSTTIFEVSSEMEVAFMEPIEILNTFESLLDIQNCKAITVTDALSNRINEFKINKKGEKVTYTANGAPVEESKFKTRVYEPVIAIAGEKIVSDARYTKPEVTVEFKTVDSTDFKVEYVPYNDRYYAIYKDGKCNYITLKKNVENMLDSIG